MTLTAIDNLIASIDEKACPLVVGLDPILDRIPLFIHHQAEKEYGNTLQGVAEALYRFNHELLDVLHPLIPAVKLQMACYELYGKWGIEVFDRTVSLAKNLGLIVIDDSKRNDIGSTASLYAVGHLGEAPLFRGQDRSPKPDFLTINPYLGDDCIAPFIKECLKHNRGLFILARTSNKSAGQYQEALIAGKPLYQKIAEDIQQIAAQHQGVHSFSSFGAVVGATWPVETSALRRIMPNVFFLMPGYGAQGATADQVIDAFDKTGYGAVINSSREIIFAYQSPEFQALFHEPERFSEASLMAATRMREDLLRSLRQAGRLPKNW
jgi:orotidine-5'-phosphate decarboxylase